jgi:hypothetical protein
MAGGKMVVELRPIGGELGASEEQQLKKYMKIFEAGRTNCTSAAVN